MKKALFLDRDGVVNIDHGYVSSFDQIEFVPGIFELCQYAVTKGFIIVIVTNQSGIGRGYYSQAQFLALSAQIADEFKRHDIEVAATYFCPHHPEKALGTYKQDCQCRKPKPGMLLQAAADLGLSLADCIMIGDKESDMLAAEAAGIKKRFLLSSHYHKNSSIIGTHVDALSQIQPQI